MHDIGNVKNVPQTYIIQHFWRLCNMFFEFFDKKYIHVSEVEKSP